MEDQERKAPGPKEVEWYAAGLQAWYATRLEHDKSLLTLSAGGIALLITLVSTVGIPSIESFILFVLALVAFVLCLTAVLWIFKRNSTHIEDAVNRDAMHDPWLTALDKVAASTFVAGVILSCIIGVTAAARSLETRVISMSGDKKETTTFNDSVNGVYNMRPAKADLSKSFNSVGNMAPASQNAKPAQAAAGSTSQAPAAVPAATPVAPATQASSKGK